MWQTIVFKVSLKTSRHATHNRVIFTKDPGYQGDLRRAGSSAPKAIAGMRVRWIIGK
jgi:hypothetical protein